MITSILVFISAFEKMFGYDGFIKDYEFAGVALVLEFFIDMVFLSMVKGNTDA
jgi:hypothetical protein